jgi:hypothetical protein
LLRQSAEQRADLPIGIAGRGGDLPVPFHALNLSAFHDGTKAMTSPAAGASRKVISLRTPSRWNRFSIRPGAREEPQT